MLSTIQMYMSTDCKVNRTNVTDRSKNDQEPSVGISLASTCGWHRPKKAADYVYGSLGVNMSFLLDHDDFATPNGFSNDVN